MSYEFYIILHICSLFALFASSLFVPFCLESLKPSKKRTFFVHGLSALVSFVAGFGLIAKTNTSLSFHHHLTGYIIFFSLLALFLLLYLNRSSLQSYAFSCVLFYVLFVSPLLFIQPKWLGIKMSAWMVLSFSPLIWKRLSFHKRYIHLQYPLLFIMVCLAVASVFTK